ncbi:hypothetical protein ACFXMT_14170 [Streptomyces mirabilis]|uniref:hypothetical protein n=1 Tax=Streptomyces mirabilis TaxID=68239 RepID=UPI0036B64D4B
MRVRDAAGLVWEEQSDGSFRHYLADGGYYEEFSQSTLERWWGPLTEVAEQ